MTERCEQTFSLESKRDLTPEEKDRYSSQIALSTGAGVALSAEPGGTTFALIDCTFYIDEEGNPHGNCAAEKLEELGFDVSRCDKCLKEKGQPSAKSPNAG